MINKMPDNGHVQMCPLSGIGSGLGHISVSCQRMSAFRPMSCVCGPCRLGNTSINTDKAMVYA